MAFPPSSMKKQALAVQFQYSQSLYVFAKIKGNVCKRSFLLDDGIVLQAS